MELGGKAPVIVLTMRTSMRWWMGCGPSVLQADCTAACRIYAQQGIYDQLVEKLGAAVASLKMGRRRTLPPNWVR